MAYIIKQTQYNDPDQKSGQHTNGPANVFVREDDSCPWFYVADRMALNKVKSTIEEIGLGKFQRRFCAKVAD